MTSQALKCEHHSAELFDGAKKESQEPRQAAARRDGLGLPSQLQSDDAHGRVERAAPSPVREPPGLAEGPCWVARQDAPGGVGGRVAGVEGGVARGCAHGRDGRGTLACPPPHLARSLRFFSRWLRSPSPSLRSLARSPPPRLRGTPAGGRDSGAARRGHRPGPGERPPAPTRTPCPALPPRNRAMMPHGGATEQTTPQKGISQQTRKDSGLLAEPAAQ